MEPDRYRYFRLEARELLDQFGAAAIALEAAGGGAAVAKLLRLAHTLKGAARVVKQAEIAERAHAIEEALAPYRDDGAAVPRERVGAILAHLDDIAARVAALSTAGAPAAAPAGDETVGTIRAEIAELDALLDRVVATQAALDRLHLAAAPHDRGVAAGIDRVERELQQLRTAAEQLRLVPAQSLFTPLERTARDAARALGKEVAFHGSGGDIRLGADILAAVLPALVQIVRNAVAHGIERAAERRAAGKPLAGRIDLDVARRGGRIVFACRDDGAGIDLDAVRLVAVRRGLVSPAATQLAAADLVALMLRGGISTAAAVTELSGRGVGLDVVRAAAERMGGAVAVQTRAGGGTEFELSVPASLTAIAALAVEVGGATALIPLAAVRGAVRIAAADVAHGAAGAAVPFEAAAIPFLPLAHALGAAAEAPEHWSCVVVAGAAGTAALGVERLLGAAPAVMRPLPETVPANPLVAGAALAADGTPQLVLNPDGLVAAALRAEAGPPAVPAGPRPVLVVDDSLTTRMLEQSILESAGYEVDLAVSGEDGLNAARRKRYSLYLVDVEMPGMDGFAFVERTRADPQLRAVPAVLVSSRAGPEDRRRGLAAGASGYIDKGAFDQAELLALIGPLTGAVAA